MDLYSTQPPVPVLVSTPDRDSSIFVRFDTGTTITGTTGKKVWDVSAGQRFVLKGGALLAFVTVDLPDDVTTGLLAFWDDSIAAGNCVYPIAAYGPDERANTALTDGVLRFDLGAGQASKAVSQDLFIGTSETIDTGKIRVIGTLWGEEISQ